MLNTDIQNLSTCEAIDVTEVFCDFDGTITSVDATDAILEAFALPAWRNWERRWVAGEISSQECLSRQVELIQAERDTVVGFAAELPIDEGIIALGRRCAERSVPLTIVSDGLDLVVETVLRLHGLLHLPVFSNHLRWDENGRPSLSFPFAARECESGAGMCKCSLALPAGRASSSTVYIGDGQSDRCVSSKIRTVFAKGVLQGWCKGKGITYIPFETLTEVTEHLFPRENSTR